MTDAQKLEALMQKAIDGGWSNEGWKLRTYRGDNDFWALTHIGVEYYYVDLPDECIKAILFDRDFAKTLWGEDRIEEYYTNLLTVENSGTPFVSVEAWQYHLQQAVILPTTSEQIGYMYRTVFGV